MSNGPTDEQIAVIRTAHIMLSSLTTTFKSPSTSDRIGRAAAANFNALLMRARQAFPTLQGLSTVSEVHSFDPLPGLIAGLSALIGSLPSLAGPEERRPGFV